MVITRGDILSVCIRLQNIELTYTISADKGKFVLRVDNGQDILLDGMCLSENDNFSNEEFMYELQSAERELNERNIEIDLYREAYERVDDTDKMILGLKKL